MTNITETRPCNKCLTVYPISNAYYQAIPNSSDGFRKTCRSCKSKSDSARYEANREQIKSRVIHNYWQNPQKKAEYDREYRAKNKTRIQVDKGRWAKRYRQQNPFLHIAKHLNHNRAYKPNYPVTKRDITRLLQRANYECIYCGENLRDLSRLEMDHVVPRKRGGVNGISNYQPACVDCNKEKSYRFIMEWRLRKIVPLKNL